MCNIAHWFNDWGTGRTKKKRAAEERAKKAQQEAEAKARQVALGNTEQETATAAQTNKSNDRTITSLRVPLSTQGTGGNVDANKRLGLNLLG